MATRELLTVGVLFNLYWLLAVLGQNSYLWLLVGSLLVCWWMTRHVWKFATIIAGCGIAMDVTLISLGVLSFEVWGIPAWLALLWFGFGTFLWMIREVLNRSSTGGLVLLGGLGGAASYFAGYRLGAVDWPLGILPTMAVLTLCWLGFSLLALKFIRYWYRSEREVL
ncbi:DUF2878 domain-containing protein [Photobacterium sp. TY1-4]|uniref:DUF2878 domain-containing protein n=1 Tax=Photobacterium sp. TY1-4 TaxID=2899122 RepID=UPI0021C19DD3|nr:DUF2878 domain-containing protein [Photobacterium sp. TY1-4]UXI04067.1 DUF2878 domain-containing protein [Photobacterium sp. TY1-4]